MFSLKRFNGRWLRPGREAPQVSDTLQDGVQQQDGEATSTGRGAEGRLVDDYSSEELHFIVDYVGSAQISEAQSVTLLLETIKRVKRHQVRSLRVDFSIRDGVLKVSCVDSNSLVLTAPLYAVALCAHEQLRGFESTFGCNITRKGTHMSHVFQAGNQYEAASIVRTMAFSFKIIGKMIREKKLRHVRRQRNSTSNSSSERTRTNSEVSTTSTVEECARDSRRLKTGVVENAIGKKPAHAKVGSKKFSKSSASSSILRHPDSGHTSGRHVEFSALSPVPSDGSDSDGRETTVKPEEKNQMTSDQRVIEVEVYPVPLEIREVSTLDMPDIAGHTKLSLEVSSPVQEQRTCSTQPKLYAGPDAGVVGSQSFHVSSIHNDIIPDSFGFPEQALLPCESEEIQSAVNAIMMNDKAPVEKFLDDGLSVNASDSSCRTLLHHAVAAGKADMVQMLLQRGALVNCEGPEDKSPLHIAAAEGNMAVTQLLLASGANVRAKDNTFCTPLHMSVRHQSNLEVSHLLIEHGARIYENNIQGKRPLDLDPTLKEMQRLLVKSACEAFAAADVSKSRSSSNASSYIQWSANSSFRSKSSAGSFRRGSSLQNRRSSSLCSIASTKGATTRAKAAIHRSESIHLARTLSPLLGNTKRATLVRSRSLQRPPKDLRRDFATAPEEERPGGAAVPMTTDGPVESNVQQSHGSAKLTSQDHVGVTQTDSSAETGADAHTDAPDEASALQKIARDKQGVAQPSVELESSAAHGHVQIVHSGLSECEDNSLLSTGSHVIHDEDSLIDALRSIVLLSGNPECHLSLLAHLCLPKASAQLVALAHLHEEGSVVANHIALLIGNLFNLEGPDSRKRSVESGLIKTVLKLVNSIEPVQSTCLSILHNILDFDNDREYSTALNNIPLDPLLNLLQASDADSGACDLRPPDSPPPPAHAGRDRQRHRKRSSCSQSSFDEKHREMSPVPVAPSSGTSVQRNNSGASDGRSHKRSSMCSMASSAEEHAVPFYCPGFGHTHLPGLGPVLGLGPDLHAKALPKLVASKMLAATSVHPKMRRELGKIRPLSLLLEASADRNVEIAIYATAALANIAAGLEVHSQVMAAGCAEALKQLLSHGDPWVRYHATRGLIYLGHVNVDKIYLFKRIPGDGKLDVVFADTSEDERLYVRGATVEKIVEILSNNPHLLWGGLNLPAPSPHQCRDRRGLGRTQTATEEQIIDFLLTVYQSFVHPVILLRLLIHRFHDPWFDKYFDGDPSTGQIEQYSPLPLTHIHLMRLWKAWLENYPEHFAHNDGMASELSDLIIPMRQAGGPYLPCADSLEDLMCHVLERASAKHSNPTQENHLHHSTLFEKCKKAVLSEQFFYSVDDAVYLAALQLYIEDLSPSRGRTWFQGGGRDKISASRIRQVLSPSMQKERNITRRIKTLHEQFVLGGMSERSAKHIYIECCQDFPSYGCRFFRLKESVGTISRSAGPVRRLLCISPRTIVLLDDKTKMTVGTWQFKELKRWTSLENDTRLRVEFVNLSFEFLLEDKSIFKAITEVMFSCTRANFKVLAEQDFSPWSKYAEETEIWGPRALDVEAQKPGLGLKYDGDSNAGPRGRATSCAASSVPGHLQRKFQRQHSAAPKFSTSAPHPQGNMGAVEPSNLVGTETEFGTPEVKGSPPGQGSPSGTHNSEEHLLGSLQSTPASPRWWEPSSLPNTPGALSWSARKTDSTMDEQGFPTEPYPLSPSGARAELEDQAHSQGSASFRSEAERDIAGLSQRAMFSGVVPHEDVQSINSQFLLSPGGQLLVCHCPPDAEMPGFDRLNFTAFDLLQHPKELARQLALIDHECYRAVTAEDLQKKIAMGTGKKGKHRTEPKLTVERVADRFNQLSTWVVASILTEDAVERRAQMFINFIETAKLCLELRNFNAVMAIVVAALGSAPIRRLYRTKERIPKEFLEQFAKMEILMDTRNNYKRYRETLRSSPTPTVPYFGIFMKDLTFIAEGNPDYLKGGLINLTKRRQVYLVIEQVRRFQKKRYNFQEVPEVHQYLTEQEIHTEEELHKISRQLEPGLPRRYSETSSGPGPLGSFNRASARRKLSLNRTSTTLTANSR